jgi:hypothetical protein
MSAKEHTMAAYSGLRKIAMTILQILFQSMDGGTAAQSCDPFIYR